MATALAVSSLALTSLSMPHCLSKNAVEVTKGVDYLSGLILRQVFFVKVLISISFFSCLPPEMWLPASLACLVLYLVPFNPYNPDVANHIINQISQLL